MSRSQDTRDVDVVGRIGSCPPKNGAEIAPRSRKEVIFAVAFVAVCGFRQGYVSRIKGNNFFKNMIVGPIHFKLAMIGIMVRLLGTS